MMAKDLPGGAVSVAPGSPEPADRPRQQRITVIEAPAKRESRVSVFVYGKLTLGRRRMLLAILALMGIALLLPVRPLMAQDHSEASRQQAGAVAEHRDPYMPRVPARAIAYQRAGYALTAGSMVWNLLGLWLLLQSGLSARLRDAVERRLGRGGETPPSLRVVAAYFLVLSLLLLLWGQPVDLLRWLREQYFGFSRQSFGGYLGDAALDWVFGLLLIPVIWGGYALYARAPRRWWLPLWAALIPLLFVLIVLQPVVIAPAYNRYTPMAPGPLRDRILALAARAGITGGRVLVEDTSRRTRHVNAYVTGLGPSTRIVLNDTALHSLPPDELLAMMGHELGHYVEGHIWVGFVTGSLGAGALLWLLARLLPWAARRWGERWGLRGVDDPAALPLVLLVLSLLLLAQAPVAGAISRTLERRADAFGLRLTGLNDATARLFVGFAERDYSDPDPPRLYHLWFGSHPTISERIAFARRFTPSR